MRQYRLDGLSEEYLNHLSDAVTAFARVLVRLRPGTVPESLREAVFDLENDICVEFDRRGLNYVAADQPDPPSYDDLVRGKLGAFVDFINTLDMDDEESADDHE